jgi:hypothetical protein
MTGRLALVIVASLALPAIGLAKGPVAATVSGPGLDGAVVVPGNGEGGDGTPLGRLVEAAGFYAIAFGQEPNPMLPARPQGELGPKYTITYSLPGPSGRTDRIVEDVYPYARPSAVTYARAGQRFFGSQATRGGWSVGSDDLKPVLVQVGIPATADEASAGSDDVLGVGWDGALLAAGAAALLVGAGAVVVARRRRPGWV